MLYNFLSSGDPSVFGNLPPPPAAYEGVQEAVASRKHNGYGHSSGLPITREAVAAHFSSASAPLTWEVSAGGVGVPQGGCGGVQDHTGGVDGNV